MPDSCPHTRTSIDPGFIWRCVIPIPHDPPHYLRRFTTDDEGRPDPITQWLLPTPADAIPDALTKAGT